MRLVIKNGSFIGKIQVIKEVPTVDTERYFEFKCHCGDIFTARLHNLRTGNTNSCGCVKKKMLIDRNTTHGMTNTPEFNVWQNMCMRCHNVKATHYKYYGERGIKVCKRWRNSFENFFADMGKRPSPKHSIERVDVNGDYSPKNCIWIENYRQYLNRTDSRFFTFNGETKTISQWATFAKMNYDMVWYRLNNGWSVQDAITLPAGAKRK